MSEMDLLKRIEALENKVAVLENTLNTIGMMEKSERIIVYCKIGSQMLQSSRQLGCNVHPLSEYYDNR